MLNPQSTPPHAEPREPGARIPNGERVVLLMEKLGASELLDTPEHAKKFLDSLSFEGFMHFLGHINGLARDIPSPRRGKVSDSCVVTHDAQGAASVVYNPPNKQHREQLMEMALEKAQSVHDPELAGLTLGIAINAIHFFEDGNGRMSRFMYILLSQGFDSTKESIAKYKLLLTNESGREVADLNPSASGLDQNVWYEMLQKVLETKGYAQRFKQPIGCVVGGYQDNPSVNETPETLLVNDSVSMNARYALHIVLQGDDMGTLSLMKTFPPERMDAAVQMLPDGQHAVINIDDFLPTLTEEEIMAWYVAHKHIVASYVARLINVADRPDVAEIAAFYRTPQLIWT